MPTVTVCPGAERADLPLHVGEQLAAVAEPGQRVGRRVVVAASSRSHRVVEGDRERGQQEHDRDDRADRRDVPRPCRVGAVRRGRPGRTRRRGAPRRRRAAGSCRAPARPAATRRLPTRVERRSTKREVVAGSAAPMRAGASLCPRPASVATEPLKTSFAAARRCVVCGRRGARSAATAGSKAIASSAPCWLCICAMTTCARRVSSTRRSNCTTAATREEPEHPHSRQQHGRAAEHR